MKLLTKEQQESYENTKICYICKEKFENTYSKDKKCRNLRDHCHYSGEYRGPAHGICSLKYSLPKKLPIDFHNGSNYDYHFILKEVVEEFKKQFTRLGENTEKYITYAALIEKEITRIDKNGEETKNIYLTYCNLLIAQDLWQTHSQILSIIFLKGYIDLDVNTDMMIKNVRHAELNISIMTVLLNT